MPFTLPEFHYAHDALAPYMSRETLEYHHDKHHKAFVDNGNKLLEGSGLEGKPLEEIVKSLLWQECRALQQCLPTLQPLHFLKWMAETAAATRFPPSSRPQSTRISAASRR